MSRFNFRHYNKLAKNFTYYGNGEIQVDLNRDFKSGLVFSMMDNSSIYMGTYSELQQCTGIKDKNGRLIYEGDILKIKDIKPNVAVRYKGLGFELYAEPTNIPGYHNDKYIPEDCEVIGNIYENEELIGGADAKQV